jgi:ankyrin repeat protein
VFPKDSNSRKLSLVSLWVFSLILALAPPASALSGDECLVICQAGTVREVQSMLDQHDMGELFRVRDESGLGLLHHCVRRSEDYWRPLLQAGWLVKAEKGWTPQHEAALLGKLEAMKALQSSGADLSVREPVNGGTPLHVAAFNGHLEVVKLLVASGVEVNARDREGWTALSQARDQGYPAIVDWLKKNGATR